MFTRKLFKIGKYSYIVSIPRDVIRKLRWQKGQRLELELKGKKVIIKDWKSK